jgi:hypothetical protein
MKKKLYYNILKISVIVFAILGLLLFITTIINQPIYFKFTFPIDSNASNFGQFFGGLVGTIFVITSTLLIILTIQKQNIDGNKNKIESHFFKMLDYHNDNVKSLNVKHIDFNKPKATGRRAFVVFRLQLIELLRVVEEINKKLDLGLKKKHIIDIAYISFYYGIGEKWKDFLTRKLIKYNRNNEIVDLLIIHKDSLIAKKSINIGRTNQTSLSSYYRNMYNAIKFIDDDNLLSLDEQRKLIKILRAQLSNPELYVLYLNVVSRFGKNWIEKNYIIKYEFIKNIPRDYCGKYDPIKKFKMDYEEDELN